MADLPVGNEGPLNSTTAVTALAAPGASTQRVIPRKGVSVNNLDTVVHNIVMQKNKAATITVIQRFGSVAALGGTAILDKVVVLDATDESFEIVMEEALTTTQPDFDVSAMETT